MLNLPFDGSIDDTSTNHFPVFTNGGTFVTDRHGQANSAFALSGDEEYAALPYDTNLYPTEMTFSMWANFKVMVSSGVWRTANPAVDDWRGHALFLEGRNLIYADGTGSFYNAILRADDLLTSNQWYHIVITRSSDSASLFINGVKIDSQSDLTPYVKPVAAPMTLGCNQNFDGSPFQFAPMVMDDVHIFNRALSDEEVVCLYDTESAPPKLFGSSLVLDLPFDGTAEDAGKNHFPVTTNNGGIFATDRNGQEETAFKLDGTNQFVSLAYTNALYPTEFTFSMWANFKVMVSSGLWRTANPAVDDWRGHALYLEDRNLIYADGTGSFYNALLRADDLLTSNQWYHIVISRSSNSASLFINGVKIDCQSGLTPYVKPVTAPMTLGCNQNFDGSPFQFSPVTMDEVHIYDRALSDPEVAQLYTHESGLPVNSLTIRPVPYVRLGMNMIIGQIYQLESTTNLLDWIPVGPAFTATNSPTYLDFPAEQNQQYFRLLSVP